MKTCELKTHRNQRRKIVTVTFSLFCGTIAANLVFAQTWTQTSATSNAWATIACSADGMKLFTGAGPDTPSGPTKPIYVSTNGGLDWSQTSSPSNAWISIASSADGTKLVAAVKNGGIYTSKNGGLNWTSNKIASASWQSVASSTDGAKFFCMASSSQLLSGQLYLTTNSGISWVSNAAPMGACWITCSADGTKLTAASLGGYIHGSTNLGASWTTNYPSIFPNSWGAVASSADGNVLAAVAGNSTLSSTILGFIIVSTNAGATWFSSDVPLQSWRSVAVSEDGTKLIAAAWRTSSSSSGPIYTSTNSGATWAANNISNSVWSAVACSADGAKLMTVSTGDAVNGRVVINGHIWTSQTAVPPKLNITPTNGLELSWLIPSTDFVLQQSDDLISWADVTNAPVLNLTNLQNQVTLEPSGSPGFYRLKTP